MPHGAHLVGSIAAANAEEAMTTAATILAGRVKRLPDGETGDRNQWIGWQIGRMLAVPGITMDTAMKRSPVPGDDPEHAQYTEMPQLRIAEGTVIPGSATGYAEAAIKSYGTFRSLRDRGVIPAGVRFQVSLPTPYAVVVAWGALGEMERFHAAYKRALGEELDAIGAAIPADDLSVQFDVAVEIGVLEGAFVVDPSLASFDRIVDELAWCLERAPAAEIGLHLCYGDYGHRHFTVPGDLSLPVRIANAAWTRRRFDYVHFPADRETARDPRFFAPLADLDPDLRRTADIALGVIDYEGDPAVIDALVGSATRAGIDFMVATECGMGRVGERGESVTVADLLAQHARVTSPLAT